jgi:hypothetical protein
MTQNRLDHNAAGINGTIPAPRFPFDRAMWCRQAARWIFNDEPS